MKSEIRQYINELGEKLYRMLNLEPNFNINEVVENLGGRLELVDNLGDVSARIEKISRNIPNNTEDFLITVSESDPLTRRRFSIAHELGHLFLHMDFLDDKKWNENNGVKDSIKYRYGHSVEETEAHEFAASFLMPVEEFVSSYNELKMDNNSKEGIIRDIAQRFGVSESAASIRIDNLKNRGVMH